MKQYDVYGIGNALVDTEYEVDDAFLDHAKLPKGIMTLIEEADRKKLIRLLEVEHEHLAVKQAGGGSAANTMVIVSQLGSQRFIAAKSLPIPLGTFLSKTSAMRGLIPT